MIFISSIFIFCGIALYINKKTNYMQTKPVQSLRVSYFLPLSSHLPLLTSVHQSKPQQFIPSIKTNKMQMLLSLLTTTPSHLIPKKPIKPKKTQTKSSQTNTVTTKKVKSPYQKTKSAVPVTLTSLSLKATQTVPKFHTSTMAISQKPLQLLDISPTHYLKPITMSSLSHLLTTNNKPIILKPKKPQTLFQTSLRKDFYADIP